jgi:hypothetical protein
VHPRVALSRTAQVVSGCAPCSRVALALRQQTLSPSFKRLRSRTETTRCRRVYAGLRIRGSVHARPPLSAYASALRAVRAGGFRDYKLAKTRRVVVLHGLGVAEALENEIGLPKPPH